MSSLKATQSDGYYIPPDYLNSGAYKKKSLNQYQKSKGHNQYLQNNLVRFELPYDGFCLNEKCKCHVAKGTRFNAQKEHVDNYHSSKIWEFRMKCRSCSNAFIIRTNVEQRCFDYMGGIQRKHEEFDTVQAQSLGVIDTEYGHAIHNFTNGRLDVSEGSNTALDKLEKEVVGRRKVMSDLDAMKMVMTRNHCTSYDDAGSNSNLRKIYRNARKKKKQKLEEARSLGLGKGILLDDCQSKDFRDSTAAFQRRDVVEKKAKRMEIDKFQKLQRGIFSSSRCNERGITATRNHRYKVLPLKICRCTKPKEDVTETSSSSKKMSVEGNPSSEHRQNMSGIVESAGSSLLALLDYGSDSSD
jgi:Uncharacterized conserved protein